MLPDPVAIYLRRAMGSETRRIAIARLKQSGEVRMERTSRWGAFEAEETVHPADVAFEWNARVPIGKWFHLRVRESYRHGHAEARVRLQSLVTLGHDKDSEPLDRGALYRFLAEAPWYPSALYPSAHLRWEAIDAKRALATLENGRCRVALEFRFDTFDDVAGIYTPQRPRRRRGGYENAAWEGRFQEYREHQGLRIPTRGEVGWHEDGRWDSVWRGKITEARYEFG